MLRLLGQATYRRFFVAFTAGNFAEGLTAVATPFVILAMTGDPALVGMCLAAQTAGVLVMAFPGASIADRFPRQRVIAAAYSIAGIALVGILVALINETPAWTLAVGLFVFGAAIATYGPASDAMTPMLVDTDHLHRANAMDGLSQRLGQGILGPLVGGGLAAAQLGVWAFLISAALCFAAAVIMLGVRPASQPNEANTDQETGPVGWSAVARFFKASPVLVILLVWVSFAVMLQVGAKPVVATTWATQLETGGAGLYGLALSVGSIVAAIVVFATGSLPLPQRYIQYLVAAWSLGAGVLIVAVIMPSAWAFVAAYALSAGLMAIGNVYWSTYMQTAVPGRLLARVISIDWVASLALTPLGALLAGFAVREWGAGHVFAAVAILPLASGLVVMVGLFRHTREPAN